MVICTLDRNARREGQPQLWRLRRLSSNIRIVMCLTISYRKWRATYLEKTTQCCPYFRVGGMG